MIPVSVVAEIDASQSAKIRSFAQLPDGWHYGEGCAATEQAVTAALDVNAQFLMHIPDAVEVFPAVDGGVMVCGYWRDHMLEIICGPSGRLDMVHELDDEVTDERGDVSLDEVTAYMGEMGWKPQKNLSGCSIPGTSVSTEGDSRVWLSSHRPEGEFLYSTRGALSRAAGVSAVTLRNFTPGSLAIHGYSGGSDEISFRSVAN